MGGRCSRISRGTPEARSRLCVCQASFLMTFATGGASHASSRHTSLFLPGKCHGWRSLVEYSSVLCVLSHFSRVQLFATPWTSACQASLSIINSQSLLKFMSIELVMPSNHLILCCPLCLLPSIFPSIRVFSNESALHIRWSKY